MSHSISVPEPAIVENSPVPSRAPDEPPTFLLPDEMVWKKIIPAMGEASPRLTILRHDRKTLATTMLIWTPPNFHVPLHWHSGSEKHMVVKGTFIIECGGSKVTLKPGAFNYLPARTIHQAWTPADDECLLLTDVDTVWDVNWLGQSPG